MADNNKLELVVDVDVNKANASIKSINTGLSSMEQVGGESCDRRDGHPCSRRIGRKCFSRRVAG